ncbi:MAG: enoyl-CoA hydratase/isomerase family protein [Saprospiraceae bacterium]|nr:enoyl-CoA hydratase/isomerase family protein [Pyrinomonadaceae bacterium]
MLELLISKEESICYLTLNRPEKRNALNDELIYLLKESLRDADGDEGLRAIVIKGEGKDFCSGADLAALQKMSESSYDENLEDARSLMELFLLIRAVKIPVIAAVHGRALAGGCGLATACDLILAAETARFGYPEVKIGFVPAMVMAILRRNLSEKRAFEMITQGFEFSASEAKSIGLVNRIFSDADFDEKVKEYALVYEKVSRSAIIRSKTLLYQMDGLTFHASMEAGAEANAIARMTEDCRKGIAKFLLK